MKGQDIKHRINGARETVKITRAMQLVSASKMSKAERKLEKSGVFLSLMFDVVKKMGKITSPLAAKREVGKRSYIVIAGDQGLCGDYNHRILDYAAEVVGDDPDAKVYAVGQFVREYFNKKKIHVNNRFLHLMQGVVNEEIRDMAYYLADSFIKGETDEIYIVFTLIKGKNPSRQTPCAVRLFPVEVPVQTSEEGILEYPKDEDNILKQYIWAYIDFALCSAECAVNYKCMTAMQQATTNGEELVEGLNRQYNHIRQEKITSELMDSCFSGVKAGDKE